MLRKMNVATGFYTNWDTVAKIDDELLRLIKTSGKKKPEGPILNSMEEATYTLAEALESGGPAEAG